MRCSLERVVADSTRCSDGRFCAPEVLHCDGGSPRTRRSDPPSRRSNPPSPARVSRPVGAPAATGLPRAAGALAAAVSARSIRVLTRSIGSRRSRCSSALRFRASGPLLTALCVGRHFNCVSVANKLEPERYCWCCSPHNICGGRTYRGSVLIGSPTHVHLCVQRQTS